MSTHNIGYCEEISKLHYHAYWSISLLYSRVKNVINKLKEAFDSIETSQDNKIQSIREKNSERIQQLR